MYNPFSVSDTLKTAWYLLRKNFSVISIFALLGFLGVVALAFIIYVFLNGNLATSIGIVVLLIGVSFIFLGFVKLIFQLIDKEYYDFEFSDIVPTIRMQYSYLLLLIMVSTLSVLLTNAIKALDEGWTQNILGIVVGGFFQFFFLPSAVRFPQNAGKFQLIRRQPGKRRPHGQGTVQVRAHPEAG